MNCIRVTFIVTPNIPEASELLIAQLGEYQFESFVLTNNGFEAYIPGNKFINSVLKDLYTPIPAVIFSYKIESIPDQNWNKLWEENFFKPIKIGDEVMIRGSFHEKDEHVKYDIQIDPKMAFGTGHHETTGLMIKYILEQDCEGMEILDIGCGTGILGILCSKLGAKQIIGIDIEEWAYNNAVENCKLNGVNNMTIIHGNASKIGKRIFNLILANINRNILLKDISKYARAMNQNGILLLSGFYTEDFSAINDEAKRHGLYLQSSKSDNNWMALSYRKAK